MEYLVPLLSVYFVQCNGYVMIACLVAHLDPPCYGPPLCSRQLGGGGINILPTILPTIGKSGLHKSNEAQDQEMIIKIDVKKNDPTCSKSNT